LYHIDMGRDRIFSFFMLKTFPHPITTQSQWGEGKGEGDPERRISVS
jgi:hypothetical protein